MKIIDILYEATDTALESPYSSLVKDGKGTAKSLRSGKIPFLKGSWKKKSTGEYESKDDGHSITLKFRNITVYANDGRLRNPQKTKYMVFIEIMGQGIYGATIDFGSSRGENDASRVKIETAKKKVRMWAEKACGIHLGEYDFKY